LTLPLPPPQGYLALTLLLHENSDLIRLIINSIRKDLDDHSEINNCLALHAIANIGGKEMAESLAPDVHRLLISPVSIPFVKKKAALTLLRLYRKHPSVIPLAEWGERIVTIMDDDNLVRRLSRDGRAPRRGGADRSSTCSASRSRASPWPSLAW
jgi:AP-2 complex subunit alpha